MDADLIFRRGILTAYFVFLRCPDIVPGGGYVIAQLFT